MVNFSLSGKTAAVTGGGGVLGGAMAKALAEAGAKVAILDLNEEAAKKTAESVGNGAIGVASNVLEMESIQAAYKTVADAFGKVDILVNGAGGNMKAATTSEDNTFFDLPIDAMRKVIDLNLFGGSILVSQAFAKEMVKQDDSVIINISSMNAFRPLTKIIGYSAAKAAVNNVTQWLAVHLAQNYNKSIRVNAIAPGFFLTQQNRFLLTDEATGDLTPRGEQIIAHTPMGRFGDPEDLVGTLVWLCSDAAKFVTGIVVPVDGGFSAYSGV